MGGGLAWGDGWGRWLGENVYFMSAVVMEMGMEGKKGPIHPVQYQCIANIIRCIGMGSSFILFPLFSSST